MPTVLLLIGATFLTAALSLVGGLLFLTDTKIARKVQKFGPLIAVAILFYATFGDIIPEILEDETLPPLEMTGLILLGFILCGIFGWILGHFHHHADAHKSSDGLKVKQLGRKVRDEKSAERRAAKNRTEAFTMLIVDTIHNAADGIVIGASFIASPATGLTTCLATIAHEIPQEVGDFSIMQKAKLAKKTIIKYQFLSALIIVPVALLTFLLGDALGSVLPTILSIVAGFLLYIAFSELYYIYDLIRAKIPKQLK